MAGPTRIKKRALRGAVRDNVEQLRGEHPLKRRFLWGTVVRAAGLVLVPTGLFAGLVVANLGDLSRHDGDALLPISEYRPRSAPLAATSELRDYEEPTRVSLPNGAPVSLGRGVLPLPVRTVVLDPGHGGASRGAEGPGELVEKSLALDIAERLRGLLEESAFQVAMTRYADETVTLEERAELANELEADIFVSIHLNWIETREQGVETYYLGPTDDPYLTELAAEENRGSGYSLADFRRLLEQVYVQARQEESRHLASEIHRSLYRSLKQKSPDLRNRGVKTAPFIVLTGTEMPAVLAEVSCLSNSEEARLLRQPEYRQFIAEALFNGIERYSESISEGTREESS